MNHEIPFWPRPMHLRLPVEGVVPPSGGLVQHGGSDPCNFSSGLVMVLMLPKEKRGFANPVTMQPMTNPCDQFQMFIHWIQVSNEVGKVFQERPTTCIFRLEWPWLGVRSESETTHKLHGGHYPVTWISSCRCIKPWTVAWCFPVWGIPIDEGQQHPGLSWQKPISNEVCQVPNFEVSILMFLLGIIKN